ncbi:hypothetical protein [Actinoallomurus acanthiterrae]
MARNIRSLRHLEAYSVVATSMVISVLSLVDGVVSDGPRWSVLLAAVCLLVYQVTLPKTSPAEGGLLRDRSAFEGRPFAGRLATAQELWIFGPSAVNVLSPQTCDLIGATVLRRASGSVRVVVLDPDADEAVRLVSQHLDRSSERQLQIFYSCLLATVQQLRRLAGRRSTGGFEYRLLDFNPGFSLVAIDPRSRHGAIIVEFHGFRNEQTAARMHVELTREISEHWYSYWGQQFERLWEGARPAAG